MFGMGRGGGGGRKRESSVVDKIGPKKRNAITKAVQESVEKASHWIWLKREGTSWSES